VRVSPPPVPVTVRVDVPGAALDEIATASVLVVPVVVAGSRAAVTPTGIPLTVRLTLSVKSFRLMAIALEPLDPCGRLPPAGFAEREKPVEVPLTVRWSCTVRVSPPPVPVTVRGYVPGSAEDETATVAVLVVPVVVSGSKLAVTPAGSPLTVRLTLPVNWVRLMVIALAPLDPCGRLPPAGFADSEKSEAVAPEGSP